MASSTEHLPPTASRVLFDGSGLISIWYGDGWDFAACHGCTGCAA